MLLFMAFATVALAGLLVWLWLERSERTRVSQAKGPGRKAWLELGGGALCLFDFVRDPHSVSGGVAGAFGLLLLFQSVYTIVKYAVRGEAEAEYRPPGAPPPIE